MGRNRTPIVACPECGREMHSNLVGRHVRAHDPERAESLRLARNERQRGYAQTPAGHATTRRRRVSVAGRAGHRRGIARHRRTEDGRLAHNAHAAVARALKKGTLVRQPCQICGSWLSEAHHPNGYAGEHQLDVVWLCNPHHMEAHDRVAA